jgi:hypothetical protein
MSDSMTCSGVFIAGEASNNEHESATHNEHESAAPIFPLRVSPLKLN